METIYGKLNKQIESVYYTPINTDTATITIDKDLKTIKVDVNVDFILKDIKVDISNIDNHLESIDNHLDGVEKQRHHITIKGTSNNTTTSGQSFNIKFDIYLDKGVSLGTTLDSLTSVLNNTSITTSGFIKIDNVTSGVTELLIGGAVIEGTTHPREYPHLLYGIEDTRSEELSFFALTITDEIFNK